MLAHERTTSLPYSEKYLYRTARNLATDRHRARVMLQRKESILKNDWVQAHAPSPEVFCVEFERAALLREAIEHLPAELRMALLLRVQHELSDDAIVARFAQQGVQISSRTIRRYISEAYRRVAAEVESAECPKEDRLP
jgi:DNA-directed RNA polymerase specialized sigma24 family protein